MNMNSSLSSTPNATSVEPKITHNNNNASSSVPLSITKTSGSTGGDSPTVLWSIEDGVRPNSITMGTATGVDLSSTSALVSPKNLFGMGNNNNNQQQQSGGGFLNLPLPSTLMALKQKQAAALATHNALSKKGGAGGINSLLMRTPLDQSQPLLPLRAFLAAWNENPNNKNLAAAPGMAMTNSFQSRFDSSQKTIPYFSRQNIENICGTLRIETIEEFCCFPAAKVAEASAALRLRNNNNNDQGNKSPAAAGAPGTTTATTSPSSPPVNNNNNSPVKKNQTPMVDPVIAFQAITDAHRELKRVGARIDWARRLRPIYELYCPSRIAQLPQLLQAYSGEEESLWRSVREKYEHDYAVAAAVLEVQNDHQLNNNNNLSNNMMSSSDSASTIEQLQQQLQQQQQTVAMLQQMYAQSQDDLRSLAHEYNEAVAGLTERAEKAETEVSKLRLVNVEQLEWIKVLEERLVSANNNNNNNNNSSFLHNQNGNKVISSPLAAKILNSPHQMFHHQQQQQSSFASPSHNNNNNDGALRSSSTSARNTTTNNINNNNPVVAAAANLQNVNNEIHLYLRNKLTDFYSKYDPSRVAEVDAVLEQWRGKEVELDRLLDTPPAGR